MLVIDGTLRECDAGAPGVREPAVEATRRPAPCWSSSPSVHVDNLGLGGQFGTYTATLTGTGFLEQDPTTTAGQHYTLSFYVAGDSEASSSSLKVRSVRP